MDWKERIMCCTLSRVHKENKTEGWITYYKNYDQLFSDVVIIFFSDTINIIILYSDSESRLDNSEYLSIICDLVHDLPTDFKFIKIKTNDTPSEVPIETFIEKSYILMEN